MRNLIVRGVIASLSFGLLASALVYVYAGPIAHGAPLLGVILAPGWVILGEYRVRNPALDPYEALLIYSALQFAYYCLLGVLVPWLIALLRLNSSEK